MQQIFMIAMYNPMKKMVRQESIGLRRLKRTVSRQYGMKVV